MGWSPIGADLITDNSLTSPPQSIEIAESVVGPIIEILYHLESRSSERGRNVIVCIEDNMDAFDLEWDARTGVHEYGGRFSAYIVERCTSQTSKLVVFIELTGKGQYQSVQVSFHCSSDPLGLLEDPKMT